jgi:TPR repeat protein
MSRTLSRSLGAVAVLVGAVLALGCGAGTLDPKSARTAALHQACVEKALRGAPDPAVLPAALAHFSAACGDGDFGGCSTLGLMHERGVATPPDPARAAALYRLACDGGNAFGCNNLAEALLAGRGVDASPGRATELLARACQGGHAVACTRLATLHAIGGAGLRRDAGAAKSLYVRGCNAGDSDGCIAAARLYEKGLVGRDTLRALTLYEQACRQEEGRGCDDLDRLLATELAVKRRVPVPHPLEARCAAGDATACAAAGIAYHSGGVVERDSVRAGELLARSCALGYTAACAVVEPTLHGACLSGDATGCEAHARLIGSAANAPAQ